MANLTEPIGHHCLVRVSDHKLLLIGGTYSDGASHTTTYFYDSHQNVWTSGPNLTQPRFNSVQMALPNSIKVVCDRNLHHFAVIWLNIPIFCINLHSILGHNHPKKLFTDMLSLMELSHQVHPCWWYYKSYVKTVEMRLYHKVILWLGISNITNWRFS